MFFIHLFLTITRKWKINKVLKDKGSLISVVLLISISSATKNRFDSNLSYAEAFHVVVECKTFFKGIRAKFLNFEPKGI